MALAALLMVPVVAAALATQAPEGTHALDVSPLQLVRLKPADAELRRLIVEGHRRSSTFRTIVDAIHDSNAIVVVQFGFCGRGRFRSCLSHVEGDAVQRHIRVKIQDRSTENRLIATIAHELQHAVEVLVDPAVTSPEAAIKLFQRIAKGECRDGLAGKCETAGALAVEEQVLRELAADGR